MSPKTSSKPAVRVLFVCVGNICRSPAAEEIFRAKAAELDPALRIECDSAGLIDYHAGKSADPAVRRLALARGYRLTGKARQFVDDDFKRFDRIIGLDRFVLDSLRRQARGDGEALNRVEGVEAYHPDREVDEVPDPYGGPDKDFELVLGLLEVICPNLLDSVIRDFELNTG